LLLGVLTSPEPPFQRVDDEKTEKISFCMTDSFYRPQYSPGGGNQWLGCAWYSTGAPPRPALFHRFLSACKPCHLPGQYGVNTRLMVASSGFRGSHELSPLGDVGGIVPAHQLGHRTGSDGGAFDRHQRFRHQ